MNKISVMEKLNRLEKEIKFLKSTLAPKIDFLIDEKNWKKVSKELKKSRAKVFQRTYGK